MSFPPPPEKPDFVIHKRGTFASLTLALLLGALSLFAPAPAQAQSTDATLSGLTASSSTSAGGTFTALNIGTFASGTTSYTASAANSVSHVKLTPTTNDSGATVKVGKGTGLATVTSGTASAAISLWGGKNAITVEVTAEDGTTKKTYTVTVTRAATFAPSPLATSREGDTVSLQVQLDAPAPDGGLHLAVIPKFGPGLPFRQVTSGMTTTTERLCGGDTDTQLADLHDLVRSSLPVLLVVPAGRTAASMDYPLAKDDMVDPDECFAVKFSSPPGAGWSAREGGGIDFPQFTKIIIKTNFANIAFGNSATTTARYDLNKAEGSGTVLVPVTVDELPSSSEDVNVQVVATSTATEYTDAANPNDFRIVTKSVTFAPGGPKTKNLSVTINDDDIQEEAEFIQLRFEAADGNTLEDNYRRNNQARLTITANDQPPDSGSPPADPQPTPDTGGTDTGGDDGGNDPPAQSSDASLDTLRIGEYSLDLDSDTDTYTVNAYGETSLTLTPTANHPDAEITVDGETVESGADISIDLEDDGETVITIVVTAEDGTTRTYTLTVMSCPGEERKILEMFYHSTQGDMWEQSGGWNTDADLDDWHGVRTDEDGNVISLRLPDNGLSGDIPSALKCFSELSGLSELALWDNDELSGEVPDALVPAVERAVLRDVAEALELNPEWFEDYNVADLFDFSDWHGGVTTDDDGRVTELDFTGEDITGVIPGSVFELKRLTAIETGCEVTLEVEAPGRVSVMMAEGCEEIPDDTPTSGGGGCALSPEGSSAFSLFLLTLVVFAVLGRKRAR